MTRPFSLISWVLDGPWFGSPIRRRMTFAAILLVLGLLTLFPRHYLAETELMWEGEGGGGLAGMLGGGGGALGLSALLGSHDTIEADLTIARSEAVIRDAIARLHLVGRPGFETEARAEIAVRKRVEIAALRGSILQVRVKDKDKALALDMVRAYTDAIAQRLRDLAVSQADEKTAITRDELAKATTELSAAQQALTQFRLAHHLAEPEFQLTAAAGELANLQGQLDAKRSELATLGRFETPDNVQYKIVLSEVQGLTERVAAAQQAEGSDRAVQGLPTISAVLTEYENLYRNDRYYQTLYNIYSQYLQEVEVNRLSANTNMDIVEPPYIHPGRQLNLVFVALFLTFVMLALGAEYYSFLERARATSRSDDGA